MADNLLPCPFCGGEAEVSTVLESFVVACNNDECPVVPGTLIYDTVAEACAAWNMRNGERTD